MSGASFASSKWDMGISQIHRSLLVDHDCSRRVRGQDIWNELQAELAWRSTRGRQVIVDAGHMIPEQAPEAVTQAIYEIYSEIRIRPEGPCNLRPS